MRCTRCDRIALPQVLARAPDGRLVFGWCPACLASESCVVIDEEPAPLQIHPREPAGRRVRRIVRRTRRAMRQPRSQEATRRLAGVGIAGLMAAWALILAFVGGWKWIGAGDGRGLMLLTGSGTMALVSLLVWVAVIGSIDAPSVVLKVVQVAATVIAAGLLAVAISRGGANPASLPCMIACGLLVLAWIARAVDHRRQRNQKASPAS